MICFTALAIAALAIAIPAAASTSFTAKLEAPKASKERVTASKAVWVCEGDSCNATLNRKTATVRVCKKVASEVGRLTAFGTSASTLTAEELEACNAAVN